MTEGLQSAELNARRRFAAFISYAHADSAIAAKLQARLERYRLPKNLALAHTGGQAALGQIFRDREDLAAAPSLSDAIRAAIAEAEALVVICSPDAVASRWVGEEIALFRSLHPDRPILAAVVRGTPAESFPAALTEGGNEPLAADLRKEADGPSLGFLKIVAGIAGVPLDALVQRDAQRRIRRVMWITGSAIAAMLIMGVMTTLALSARNEAARQRESAEGLVEYMLTDLRDKLKGVGRLDVMEGVNERAMEHYTKQGNLNSLSADSLEQRARILHAMGEDDDRRGKLDEAQAKFSEAHRTTAALLAKSSENPDRVFAHAQSAYWVGYAAWKRGDRLSTTKHWNTYALMAQRLNRLEPQAIRSMMEIGYSEANLCDLNAKGDFALDKAAAHCRSAISSMEKAWKRQPDDNEIGDALANNYGWLADIAAKRKEFGSALAARDREAEIFGKLLKSDPKNRLLKRRLATSWMGKARILYKKARFNDALLWGRKADDSFAQLVREEPADAETRVWQLRNKIHMLEALKALNSDKTTSLKASIVTGLQELIDDGAIAEAERSNYLKRIG